MTGVRSFGRRFVVRWQRVDNRHRQQQSSHDMSTTHVGTTMKDVCVRRDLIECEFRGSTCGSALVGGHWIRCLRLVAGAVVPTPDRYGAACGRCAGNCSRSQLPILCHAYCHVGLWLCRARVLYGWYRHQFRQSERHSERNGRKHRKSLPNSTAGAASCRSCQVQRHRDRGMVQRYQWLGSGCLLARTDGLLYSRGLRMGRCHGPERQRNQRHNRPQSVEPDSLWHDESEQQRHGRK